MQEEVRVLPAVGRGRVRQSLEGHPKDFDHYLKNKKLLRRCEQGWELDIIGSMFPKDYPGHGMDDDVVMVTVRMMVTSSSSSGERNHLPKPQGVPSVRLLALYILCALNRKKSNGPMMKSMGQDPGRVV